MADPIHHSLSIAAPAAKVYQALLDPVQFSALTKAPAEIDGTAGGAFRLFGGAIVGRQIELVPSRRIVQAWRAGNWTEGRYSIVQFELEEIGGVTRLVFDHTGFPEDQQPHLDAGWHRMYWEPLRAYLG
ncbi:MAG: hypothetical protein HOP28_03705 [Gemmatimonadales bacterium]|nr:hypothetical protein [Gemmatimonadales bacterium]